MESSELLSAFVRESDELLNELEAGLLTLESGPSQERPSARIFRAAHTLKGNAA